jgi:DNA invertase Pin-like site-specific DNA recombinase
MTPVLRCACYARFSSDLQRTTSIDDQIATARRHADEQGWVLLPEHIYTDAAISGASLERPGIQALRTTASRRPRPFDVLLVDDSSRVSRDLADAVRLLQELKFAGVRVIYLSQHIDSANEQAETLVAVHGVVDSLYLREMAKKIKRGLAGQIDRGFATGSITYGYRTVPVPDPSGKTDANGYPVLLGKRVEVILEEARVIVQIFEWYASGLGVRRVVDRLNADGCKGPRGQRWRHGAVKRILANEKYRGLLIWGKTMYDRRPGTRRYVERPVPREQWRTTDRPELRIVSEDLWNRVKHQRERVRTTLPEATGRTLMHGRDAALYSPHLFSGFMTCGMCGGAMTIVSGGLGKPRYGCPRSWRNGVSACANRLTVRAPLVDQVLLERLGAELTTPDTVRYIAESLAKALNQRVDQRPQVQAETAAALEQARQRLQRLIDAIESGVPAASVAGAIAERQADVERLSASLSDLNEPLEQRLAIMPAWVRQQLEGVAGVLRGTPERTKTEFQRLGLRVTMTPQKGAHGPQQWYRADVESSLPQLLGTTEIRPTDFSTTDRLHLPQAPRTAHSMRARWRFGLPPFPGSCQ